MIEEANIETNTNDARKTLEQIKLDKDKQILSLDVKSLYTHVSVNEAINIALRSLYARAMNQTYLEQQWNVCLN